MPLAFEEDDDQRAARLADEAAHAQRIERLRAAEAQQAAARRAALWHLVKALDLVEAADPMLLGEAKAQRAVRGTRLAEQRVAAPSLGGQTPGNMERIGREEASRERSWQNEQASRERWAANQVEVAEALAAGQSPENASRIRREIRAAAGLK